MNYGNKMNLGGRLYDYMKAGGKLMGKHGYKVGGGEMKHMDKGGKSKEKSSDPGEREKGTIYYDEEAQGFFEVTEDATGLQSRLLGLRDGEKVYRHLKEQAGSEGLGLPASVESEELMEKYPGLYGYKVDKSGNPIVDSEGKKIQIKSDTLAGNQNAVKMAIQAALEKGDPALMSMVLNPYEESASQLFDNIQPYGIDRVENVHDTSTTKRGIDFKALNIVGKGTELMKGSGISQTGQKVYHPSEVQKAQVFADDPEQPGETIITPEGETIQVNPATMQTPGFGEGVPSTNPDVPRTREEGAVPYQKQFGGMIRKANEGMRMQRRTVFRFPRS